MGCLKFALLACWILVVSLKKSRANHVMPAAGPVTRNQDCSQPDLKKYFCPSSLSLMEYSNHQNTCVSIDELCDGITQCPGGEDEDNTFCLFHRAMIDRQDEIISALTLQDRLLPQRIMKVCGARKEPFQYDDLLARLMREHKKRNPWSYSNNQPNQHETMESVLAQVLRSLSRPNN